jgi:hypothetical protein
VKRSSTRPRTTLLVSIGSWNQTWKVLRRARRWSAVTGSRCQMILWTGV